MEALEPDTVPYSTPTSPSPRLRPRKPSKHSISTPHMIYPSNLLRKAPDNSRPAPQTHRKSQRMAFIAIPPFPPGHHKADYTWMGQPSPVNSTKRSVKGYRYSERLQQTKAVAPAPAVRSPSVEIIESSPPASPSLKRKRLDPPVTLLGAAVHQPLAHISSLVDEQSTAASPSSDSSSRAPAEPAPAPSPPSHLPVASSPHQGQVSQRLVEPARPPSLSPLLTDVDLPDRDVTPLHVPSPTGPLPLHSPAAAGPSSPCDDASDDDTLHSCDDIPFEITPKTKDRTVDLFHLRAPFLHPNSHRVDSVWGAVEARVRYPETFESYVRQLEESRSEDALRVIISHRLRPLPVQEDAFTGPRPKSPPPPISDPSTEPPLFADHTPEFLQTLSSPQPVSRTSSPEPSPERPQAPLASHTSSISYDHAGETMSLIAGHMSTRPNDVWLYSEPPMSTFVPGNPLLPPPLLSPAASPALLGIENADTWIDSNVFQGSLEPSDPSLTAYSDAFRPGLFSDSIEHSSISTYTTDPSTALGTIDPSLLGGPPPPTSSPPKATNQYPASLAPSLLLPSAYPHHELEHDEYSDSGSSEASGSSASVYKPPSLPKEKPIARSVSPPRRVSARGRIPKRRRDSEASMSSLDEHESARAWDRRPRIWARPSLKSRDNVNISAPPVASSQTDAVPPSASAPCRNIKRGKAAPRLKPPADGEESFCHQCRRKTRYPKMSCSKSSCNLLFCLRCVVHR
jgi:hypothetical protein